MPKDLSFAQSLKRLEEIVTKLESQDLDLEEGVELLAEGIALHKKCQEKLLGAKAKIDNLLNNEETPENLK